MTAARLAIRVGATETTASGVSGAPSRIVEMIPGDLEDEEANHGHHNDNTIIDHQNNIPPRKITVKEIKEEDSELEIIRQRALKSMIQNQQQRRLSEEKKILIPLNDETSSDEEEGEDQLSLSSRDSQNRKEQPLEDPKFIVTLDGINSSYFKKDTADKVKISMNNKPAAIIAPMKHIAEVDTNKKSSSSSTPTGTVAPRKRITAPEPDSKDTAADEIDNITKNSSIKKENNEEKSNTTSSKKDSNSTTTTTNNTAIIKNIETNSGGGKVKIIKKERKRITAPEPEKPSPASIASTTTASAIPVITTEVCKFWPRCNRGLNCLYLHPKSSKPVTMIKSNSNINVSLSQSKDKFKWSANSSK